MKILLAYEIGSAIQRCNPLKIAVAYLGEDWRSFIPDVQHLEEVIVSPTLGTNPRAVMDLAQRIGWENVHFLDELHAKFYLGSSTAIVGSANLTHNGLSGDALIELCIEFSDERSM